MSIVTEFIAVAGLKRAREMSEIGEKILSLVKPVNLLFVHQVKSRRFYISV